MKPNGKNSTGKQSLGDHVKFTKIHNRPYIDAADLVTSDEFQDAVETAAKKLSDSTKKSEDRTGRT